MLWYSYLRPPTCFGMSRGHAERKWAYLGSLLASFALWGNTGGLYHTLDPGPSTSTGYVRKAASGQSGATCCWSLLTALSVTWELSSTLGLDSLLISYSCSGTGIGRGWEKLCLLQRAALSAFWQMWHKAASNYATHCSGQQQASQYQVMAQNLQTETVFGVGTLGCFASQFFWTLRSVPQTSPNTHMLMICAYTCV